MSEEINTTPSLPSQLSVTEDAFDEFQATSMYEEDEYITLSDIAVQDDPVITNPAPDLAELSLVNISGEPTVTESGSAFNYGIKSDDTQETIENPSMIEEETATEQQSVENLQMQLESKAGRPKRNKLKKNTYLSVYDSDDSFYTKTNGVKNKKTKKLPSPGGRGRKKQSKSRVNNHQSQGGLEEQHVDFDSNSQQTPAQKKRGRPKKSKDSPQTAQEPNELQHNLSNNLQTQSNEENIVSEEITGNSLKSLLGNNIISKGIGRKGKPRKKLTEQPETSSLGSADVSISNLSVDESIVNSSVENGEEAKPARKRGRKKKNKNVVECTEPTSLDIGMDIEEELALSQITKQKTELSSLEHTDQIDIKKDSADDKDDKSLSMLKETLDNNIASDIEVDKTVVTNAVVDVLTNDGNNLENSNEIEPKRNSKRPINTDYEHNINSVIDPAACENSQNEDTEDPYLVEDKSKRPVRRKVKQVLHYDEDSDEDPYANIELSDDEPHSRKKGKRGYSDDEYVPIVEPKKKWRKTDLSDGSDSDISDIDTLERKPRTKRARNSSTNKSPKKKAKTSESKIDVKTISPKSINVEDDIENCLQSSIIKANEDGKPKTMADEFQNFIAKKIQCTDLKIKKVSSSETAQSTPLEIPVIDPNEQKKLTENSTQTKPKSMIETGIQTNSPHEISVVKNAPLTSELSEKACEFLKNVVKTTSELGQLMTEKSEDFIVKKINSSHVTDVSKMDYCVKKSFLLFKLAKHNLVQMEEDLGNQYEKFLKENGLESCLADTKKLTPKVKPPDSDSDCEIVEGPVVTKQTNKSKPAFNPKTVFLNKELSIKIAKKPAATPKVEEKKKINVKGRHAVWISDSVMVKKIKSSQSFLAQDSRNKKPPDYFVTEKMVSDFFDDYYHKQAQRICAPFVSREWRELCKSYMCCYFFVKSDNFPVTSMRSPSNNEYYATNGHQSSDENLTKISHNHTPKKLSSLSLTVLREYLYKGTASNHQSGGDHKNNNNNIEKKLNPSSLFRLCVKKLTQSSVTESKKQVFTKIKEAVVARQEVSPLKTLCYNKVHDVMSKNSIIRYNSEDDYKDTLNLIEENSMYDSSESNCSNDIFEEIDSLLVELSPGNQKVVKSLNSLCIESINRKVNTEADHNNLMSNTEQSHIYEQKYLQTPKSLKSVSLDYIMHHLLPNDFHKNSIMIDLDKVHHETNKCKSVTDMIFELDSIMDNNVVTMNMNSLCIESINRKVNTEADHNNLMSNTEQSHIYEQKYLQTPKSLKSVSLDYIMHHLLPNDFHKNSIMIDLDKVHHETNKCKSVTDMIFELDSIMDNNVVTMNMNSLCIESINRKVSTEADHNNLMSNTEQSHIYEQKYLQTPKSLKSVSLDYIMHHLLPNDFHKNSIMIDLDKVHHETNKCKSVTDMIFELDSIMDNNVVTMNMNSLCIESINRKVSTEADHNNLMSNTEQSHIYEQKYLQTPKSLKSVSLDYIMHHLLPNDFHKNSIMIDLDKVHHETNKCKSVTDMIFELDSIMDNNVVTMNMNSLCIESINRKVSTEADHNNLMSNTEQSHIYEQKYLQTPKSLKSVSLDYIMHHLLPNDFHKNSIMIDLDKVHHETNKCKSVTDMIFELDSIMDNNVVTMNMNSLCIESINRKVSTEADHNNLMSNTEQSHIYEQKYLQTPKSLKSVSLDYIMHHLLPNDFHKNRIMIDLDKIHHETNKCKSVTDMIFELDSIMDNDVVTMNSTKPATISNVKKLADICYEVTSQLLYGKNALCNKKDKTVTNILVSTTQYDIPEINPNKLNDLSKLATSSNVNELLDNYDEYEGENALFNEEDKTVSYIFESDCSENSINVQRVKTLADICFEIISKITNEHSVNENEDPARVELTINSVNTLSEEAFHNIGGEHTEHGENFGEEDTNFYSENDFDAAFNENEDNMHHEIEPEDNNWVSQVQLKELKSCFVPTKKNTDKQIVPDNMQNKHITERPVMVQIKQEPEENFCEGIDSSIVKTEPNLDEMTVVPDSIVTKQEHIERELRESELRECGTSANIDQTRRNSPSYDMETFESFISTHKLMYPLTERTSEDIYAQNVRRRRQYDPDSDDEIENVESDSLLVPQTFEPLPLETAKTSLMQSSSEDESTRKAEGKKKQKKKKPVKKQVPPPKEKAALPPQPPESELTKLTRRMRERIRQEEKKLKSSDEEPELPINNKRDKTKNDEKSKSKKIDTEIQVNNVDSTEQIEPSLLEDKFTGFTTMDQSEISNYQKYAKFVYDKILPKVVSEINFVQSYTPVQGDDGDKNEDRFPSPVVDSNEPVEMLECEPTLPVFDDAEDEPPAVKKSKLKGPKRHKKQNDTQDVMEKNSRIQVINENDNMIPNYTVCNGWHCYSINQEDSKLLSNPGIVLEKLPESFVETYFRYQNLTQTEKEDEEVNRLINLQTLNRSLNKDIKSKTKSKSKTVNDTRISEEMLRDASPGSDHLDELTPSEDEHHVDDELPPPVPVKHSENNLAKNSLMDDNSDSDEANIKKEINQDDYMDQPLLRRRAKRKEPELPEHPENLMLTADKMMNKELNLLHAPVSLTNEITETETKPNLSARKLRNAPRRHCNKERQKVEDDSSSEEEKQWVTTKEKLLKRMGKKQDTAIMDDAKRAKLVTEFIERRGEAGESRKRRNNGRGRKMSRKNRIEREKQLRVLSRELYGETSSDAVAGRPTKFSASYFKGRRNIRAVIDKKSLQRSTVVANMEEFERKCRLNERQAKLREILRCEDDVNVVVIDGELCLEYNFEERRPIVSVHPFFTKVMKAHQYEGVKFMWDACFESIEQVESGYPGGGCILAHCMGLGKTLQVLALLHTVLTHPRVGMQRVLVCCPLSTVLNWVDEIHKWIGPVTDQIKVFELSKLRKTYERAYQLEDWYSGGGIFIIGYELFRSLSTLDPILDDIRPTIINKIRTALLDPGPDIIVCDEGHLLKNDSSVLAVAMSRVITKRRIVLTGTPMQNNLREYYCMVNFIKPNLLGTYAEYSNRFENPIMNGQHRDSIEEDIKLMKQRTHILHKVLEGCLQRQEASVLYPYLPKKHEYTVFISQTKCQWDLYKHYLQNYAHESTKHTNILKDFHILQKIWSHPHVLHNFQMRAKTDKIKHEKLEDDLAREDLASEDIKPSDTEVWWLQYLDGGKMLDTLQSSNKFVVVFSILDESIRLGDKVLIFSTSLVTLDSIEFFLNKINKWNLGQEYFRLDGTVPPEVRQKWCREFNAENNINTKLFLISTRAGCLGLNMVAANRVIILDTSWNPAHDIQSIFRVYRFGQKKDCYIYRLVGLGTMEQKIYERSVTKQAVACRVVDEQQIDRHYNMAELTELYRYDEHGSGVAAGVALGVQDMVLLRVARGAGRAGLHAAHEHDSLLRGSEPGLPEHERHALWEQFQQEQTNRQMQNKLIPSFMTQTPNTSTATITQPEQTDPNLPPDVKQEQTETPAAPPAELKTYKKKKGKTIPKPISDAPTKQEAEVPVLAENTPSLIDEALVVKILNKLVKFSPRIEASVITTLASHVRSIVAERKMPDGFDAKLTKTINDILLAHPRPMPALTDVTPQTFDTPKRGRPRKQIHAEKETMIEVEVPPNVERPGQAPSVRRSKRYAETPPTTSYEDSHHRAKSDTDSASEKEELENSVNRRKSRRISGIPKAHTLSKSTKASTQSKTKKRGVKKDLPDFRPNDSILLSDDDESVSKKKASSAQKHTKEQEVPLHPSLLGNQNFIKIVAHTYLEGNPMLDEDAATLAAQYSTLKALREYENTGQSITSGPIYDIAKKVLGIDVLIKLNKNDPPVKSALATEKSNEAQNRASGSNEIESRDTMTKRNKTKSSTMPVVKPKVISDLMPKESPEIRSEPTPIGLPVKANLMQKDVMPGPQFLPIAPRPVQKPGPKSSKSVKTTMFSVRPTMDGTSTVVPVGLIQNTNMESDGPEESILPDDDVSIVSDPTPVAPPVRNNTQPLLLNRLIAGNHLKPVVLKKQDTFLDAISKVIPPDTAQPNIVSADYIQPFILRDRSVFAITTRPLESYNMTQVNTNLPSNAIPVTVNSLTPRPPGLASNPNMSNDIVCLDSDEETPPEPKGKRRVAIKSTAKQSANAIASPNKEVNSQTQYINLNEKDSVHYVQVPASMVPVALTKKVKETLSARSLLKPAQVSAAKPVTLVDTVPKPAPASLKKVPLPLCKPGNILRLTKTGKIEILPQADTEVTIIDDEPASNSSKVTSEVSTKIASKQTELKSKVSTKQPTSKTAVATPEKVQPPVPESVGKAPDTYSKPQTAKRSKTIISSSDSSRASSRSSSPDINDPLSILRDVVHIKAPEDEPPPAKVEPLKLQRVDNQFKAVSKTEKTVGSKFISKASSSSKKIEKQTDASPMKDNIVLTLKANSTSTKPTYVIKKGSNLAEAVSSVLKNPKDSQKLVGTSKNIVIKGSGKATTCLPSKSSSDRSSRSSVQVTSIKKLPSTSGLLDAKKRSAPTPPSDPPKKKPAMTLKDFNIDDIDDIIELD